MEAQEAPQPTGPLDLLRWIGWAQRKAADDWIREREISFEQGFVLGYLAQFPGTIQREIAEISRTSAASVSSMVQGLERRGLVERRSDAGDERTKRVYPTAAGVELIQGFDAAMAEANDVILEPLSEAERATLNELLTRITAKLPRPTR